MLGAGSVLPWIRAQVGILPQPLPVCVILGKSPLSLCFVLGGMGSQWFDSEVSRATYVPGTLPEAEDGKLAEATVRLKQVL